MRGSEQSAAHKASRAAAAAAEAVAQAAATAEAKAVGAAAARARTARRFFQDLLHAPAGGGAMDDMTGPQSSTHPAGYAVVSVGLGNERRRGPGRKYEILENILPRGLAERLLVDARDYLQAPPREQRPRGEYPDLLVVAGVRRERGFNRIMEICRQKLRQNGIVFVGCNAGRHRSATVAGDLGRETDAYVVHAGLSNITAEEIAALTLVCVPSWPQRYMEASLYFSYVPHTAVFALGWSWEGFRGIQPLQHPRAVMPVIPAGTALCVLGTLEQHTPAGEQHPFPCAVVRRLSDSDSESSCNLALVPLNFLVPFRVYELQRSERAPGVNEISRAGAP